MIEGKRTPLSATQRVEAWRRWNAGSAVYKAIGLLVLFACLSPIGAAAERPHTSSTADALHELNDSVQALVQRVSPSVVQIVATGYSSSQQENKGQTNLVIGKKRRSELSIQE